MAIEEGEGGMRKPGKWQEIILYFCCIFIIFLYICILLERISIHRIHNNNNNNNIGPCHCNPDTILLHLSFREEENEFHYN